MHTFGAYLDVNVYQCMSSTIIIIVHADKITQIQKNVRMSM